MGTRNITRVKSNGEVKINQYCQWDGYPTGRGLDVLKFCRDLVKGGRVGELRDYLETTSLINANKADYNNHTYTGAPYNNKTSEVFDFVYDYGRMHPEYYGSALIDKMLDEGLLTMGDAKYYAAASRDVGNDILGFIMKQKPEGMKFYTDDYLSEMPLSGDWQVEGVFLVDLDEQSVEIWWHGLGVEYPFKQLQNYSDEDLSKAMKRLEDGDIGEGVGERERTPIDEIGGMKL